MISFLDIIFIVVTVCMVIVNAHRGLLVSLIGMLRFIFIIPLSCLAAQYAEPYIPDDMFKDIPEELVPVIIFVICFLVLQLATSLIMLLLKKLQDKKGMPLRGTNAVLGGVFGLLKAALLVFVTAVVIVSVMQFVPQSGDYSDIYNSINSSYVIEFVNKLNLFDVFEI